MAAGAELRVVFLSACRGRAGPLILRLLQRAPAYRAEQHDRDPDDGVPVNGLNVLISYWLEYYLDRSRIAPARIA